MKKTLLFRLFTISFLLFGSLGWVNGQALLVENFDYTAGALLTANGWNAHSGAGTQAIDVTTGLSFNGYAGSGIGGAANLDNTGEDVNKTFTEQTTGTVYVALVIKTEATNGAGYFLNLGQTTIGTTFFSKVWVNATGDGINVGTATPASYVAITPGTPTLIVLKLEIATKTTSFYVFSTFPTTEPVIADGTATETATFANVGSIALRQFVAAEKVVVDGIRVATTWADAVAASTTDITAPTFNANISDGEINVAINTPIILTFDEAIRNIDDSEITNANVAELLTLKEADGPGTVVAFTATIDAAKKVITVIPSTNLKNGQLYYAAITPVEDAANNATTLSSMTFTTIAASAGTISDVAVAETGPYYAGEAVTITWVSSNVTEVKIEVWIPSENSWSEQFASIPSNGSQALTIPIDAQYSTDYKLRITDATNPAVTAEGSKFTIIAVASDLLTLRTQPVGAIVKYTGKATITFSRPTTAGRNQKYIQDATAAVLIDDPTTAPGFITGTYNIGDGITNIVGKIVLYGGLIEFTPTATTGEPATGIEIVPEVRTLASLTSADQCKLVKIENFAFKTPRKFVKSLTYAIDGYDSLAIAYRTIFAESDYIGGQAPVGPISSIVLVGQYNAQMQITARSWSDMVIPTSIAVTSPVGGESYLQGSTQTITWTTTNFTGDVKIELTGSNPSVIVAAVANTGSYTWDIPVTLAVASDYKVMISDAVDGDPMGESAAVFSITEKPFIAPAIVITEIMYTSPDVSAKQEWVELYNNGTTSVDMEGFYILDSDPLHKSDPIVLPAGAVIAPGEYYTIETSDNGQPELFPFVPDFISIKFNFGKADEVKIFHKNGQLIDSVSYNSVDPWPTSPNGGGSSLTLCDPNLDNSLASSWEASEDAFTTLQGTTILATPGSGCVLHTAVKPQSQSGISVYPNPTTDNLYISNPANGMLEITVLSSIGKTVKAIQSNQGVTSIDFSSMPKGIYMVKMFNKTLKTTQMNKIVVN